MKTVLKLFLSSLFLICFAIVSMGQSTDNDNIAGKATVIQGINVTKKVDLEFGNVSPGLAKTIDLVNVATGGQVGEGTQTTGYFLVSAAAGSNVQVQFTTLPANLAYLTNNLPIGTYTGGYHTATTFTGGTTFTPATGVSIANFPTNVVETVNGIYVFIGGTVTPGASQVAGAYEANITLTATYN